MQDYELRNDSLLASPNFVKLYSEYVRCKLKRDMRLNVVQTTIGMDRYIDKYYVDTPHPYHQTRTGPSLCLAPCSTC